MSMKVWFLTGNEGKVREAKKIFDQCNFELEQMSLDFLEPQVDSLEEVAKEKMKQAMAFLPDKSEALFVEDAGLFIEALNGFPGVFSSYALKTIGCQGIIRLLQHLRSEDLSADSRLRKARFEAVSGIYFRGKMEFLLGSVPEKSLMKHLVRMDLVLTPSLFHLIWTLMVILQKQGKLVSYLRTVKPSAKFLVIPKNCSVIEQRPSIRPFLGSIFSESIISNQPLG